MEKSILLASRPSTLNRMDPDDVVDRIARRSLRGAGRRRGRRGAPTARRRARGHGALRHPYPAPGRRHRRRRRPVERRLLPLLRLEGRARGGHPRGRHRAAPQLPGPPDGQVDHGRRTRSVAGSRASCRRRSTRTWRPRPSPSCGTAAASARSSAPDRPSPSAALATLLHRPLADLGSRDPELDAVLIAHAVVGLLSDHLWNRTRPDQAEIDRVVAFSLSGIGVPPELSESASGAERPGGA